MNSTKPKVQATKPRHGVDCPKRLHVGGVYSHDESDDGPYDLDGVQYCGRCHRPRALRPVLDLIIGNIYRTPWEPSGLVELLSVDTDACRRSTYVTVRYVEDHPKGYKKDSIGGYLAEELRPASTPGGAE